MPCGLGVLEMGGLPTPAIRESIRQLRALTDRRFAVDLIVPLMDGEALSCCFEERVSVLVLFWGDPSPYVEEDAGPIGTAMTRATNEPAATAAWPTRSKALALIAHAMPQS